METGNLTDGVAVLKRAGDVRPVVTIGLAGLPDSALTDGVEGAVIGKVAIEGGYN
jgi:hypothetical protein